MYNVTNSPPPNKSNKKTLCILDNSKHRIEKITKKTVVNSQTYTYK